MPSQAAYIGNPVLSLQTMLRTISFQYPALPQIIPDGIFGERTLEAVMIFQREFFPPVTGRVDNKTWDAIVRIYKQVLRSLSVPTGIGYPWRESVIRPGQSSVHLYSIQSMFQALSRVLRNIEAGSLSGVHDQASVNNVRRIQRLNQSKPDGVIDWQVWQTLLRLYNLFITHGQTPQITRQQSLNPS
jgi:peptidoglycan hydrolase-like protein with peptidoglycan-binding domain